MDTGEIEGFALFQGFGKLATSQQLGALGISGDIAGQRRDKRGGDFDIILQREFSRLAARVEQGWRGSCQEGWAEMVHPRGQDEGVDLQPEFCGELWEEAEGRWRDYWLVHCGFESQMTSCGLECGVMRCACRRVAATEEACACMQPRQSLAVGFGLQRTMPIPNEFLTNGAGYKNFHGSRQMLGWINRITTEEKSIV
jgi:hypothetical protein